MVARRVHVYVEVIRRYMKSLRPCFVILQQRRRINNVVLQALAIL